MKLNFCEEFKICLLNASNKVLGICTVSSGGITATFVDSRHVIASALLANATQIILVHNHPSGNCQPSKADQILTQMIKKAADLFDIKVADHLIISDTTYFSFATDGQL
jgi:DNA repair protein RadC